MSDLPSITGRAAITAFEKAGFSLARISKSSHHILKKPGHRFLLTIPVHGSKTLKPGTLRGLIRAAGLTVDEFVSYLGSNG
jgi:predicted RNA binding protein YcfA (HicA-like mRNA interferase family)